MAKHLYRKEFDHAFEAQEIAEGFHMVGPIDGRDKVEVTAREEDGRHFAYVALEGDFDPHETLAATGYERVS